MIESEYLKLVKLASQNLKTNEKPTHSQLLKSLNHAFDVLKLNVFAGDLIHTNQITKEVIKKYGTDKLWKYDLINYWRLIYTVKGNQTEITALILEKLPHNEYNKLYKGKIKKR